MGSNETLLCPCKAKQKTEKEKNRGWIMEYDIVVKLPPLREHKIQAKAKVTKGKLRIVEIKSQTEEVSRILLCHLQSV